MAAGLGRIPQSGSRNQQLPCGPLVRWLLSAHENEQGKPVSNVKKSGSSQNDKPRGATNSTVTGVITEPGCDPLGAMMLDYLCGHHEAAVEVESANLEMSLMTGATMFRPYAEMDDLEQRALGGCEGRVLDVGAGSGCHALWLQQRGLLVEAIDLSPGAVEVMRRRGVQRVRHANFFNLQGERYDTILMLMNGIGICGSLVGLADLLRQARRLLAPGGRLIADSTDLTRLAGGGRRRRRSSLGETMFRMRYQESVSDPFPWLYVDMTTLATTAANLNLSCEELHRGPNGRYLVRIGEHV